MMSHDLGDFPKVGTGIVHRELKLPKSAQEGWEKAVQLPGLGWASQAAQKNPSFLSAFFKQISRGPGARTSSWWPSPGFPSYWYSPTVPQFTGPTTPQQLTQMHWCTLTHRNQHCSTHAHNGVARTGTLPAALTCMYSTILSVVWFSDVLLQRLAQRCACLRLT